MNWLFFGVPNFVPRAAGGSGRRGRFVPTQPDRWVVKNCWKRRIVERPAFFICYREEMVADVRSRPSPISGLGAFAERFFGKGELIMEIDDSRIVDEAHPLGPGEDARHCDYLAGGKVVLMQPPECHINHSCDPNSYVKTASGLRLVIALRAIAKGEEITYDYCINGDGATIWFCHCGTARCRREIHSDFFHLPIDLQLEYLPLLDDWFREEKAAELRRLTDSGQSN